MEVLALKAVLRVHEQVFSKRLLSGYGFQDRESRSLTAWLLSSLLKGRGVCVCVWDLHESTQTFQCHIIREYTVNVNHTGVL